MKIITPCANFTAEQVQKICEVKEAVYVCDTTQQNSDVLVSIFRGKETHPVSGSRYFGLYNGNVGLYIIDGSFAEDLIFEGAFNDAHGEIIYSRYRHDYQVNGHTMIDGGRAYTRRSGMGCTMKVIDGELKIITIGNMKYETYRTLYNFIGKLPNRFRYGLTSVLGKFASWKGFRK